MFVYNAIVSSVDMTWQIFWNIENPWVLCTHNDNCKYTYILTQLNNCKSWLAPLLYIFFQLEISVLCFPYPNVFALNSHKFAKKYPISVSANWLLLNRQHSPSTIICKSVCGHLKCGARLAVATQLRHNYNFSSRWLQCHLCGHVSVCVCVHVCSHNFLCYFIKLLFGLPTRHNHTHTHTRAGT